MFIGRTDAEAEASIFWPPDMKSQLTGRDPDERKDRKQKKGADRMRWLDSNTDLMDMNLSKLQETVEHRGAWHPWGHKESDTT